MAPTCLAETFRIDVNTGGPNGIPPRADDGSTGGSFQPDLVIEPLIGGGVVADYRRVIIQLKRIIQEEIQERIDQGFDQGINDDFLREFRDAAEGLAELEETITDVLNDGGFINNPIVAAASVNPGFVDLVDDVTFGLERIIEQVDNPQPGDGRRPFRELRLAFAVNKEVGGFLNTINDADPYVALQGAFTNTSSSDTLDLFVNFDEGLFQALPTDTALERQLLLEVAIEDTNGDGVASAQSASLDFSAFGSTDPANPTLQNTISLGSVEGLFDLIRDTDGDSVDDPLRIVGDAAPVDLTAVLFDPTVPDDIAVTHLIGGLTINDISPGDTARFTAIVSVGINGDGAIPLLDVEELESVFVAAALVSEFNLVPEPSSMLLLCLSALGFIGRRRAALHPINKQ